MSASLHAYKKDKIKLLKRDFLVPMKAHEIDKLMELESEIQVDNYVHGLLNKYLH